MATKTIWLSLPESDKKVTTYMQTILNGQERLAAIIRKDANEVMPIPQYKLLKRLAPGKIYEILPSILAPFFCSNLCSKNKVKNVGDIENISYSKGYELIKNGGLDSDRCYNDGLYCPIVYLNSMPPIPYKYPNSFRALFLFEILATMCMACHAPEFQDDGDSRYAIGNIYRFRYINIKRFIQNIGKTGGVCPILSMWQWMDQHPVIHRRIPKEARLTIKNGDCASGCVGEHFYTLKKDELITKFEGNSKVLITSPLLAGSTRVRTGYFAYPPKLLFGCNIDAFPYIREIEDRVWDNV